MKVFTIFILSLYYVSSLVSSPGTSIYQQVAIAIEDQQVDRLKDILNKVPAEKRRAILYEPATTYHYLSLMPESTPLSVCKLPLQRIKSWKSIGLDDINKKMRAMEYLLCIYCEPAYPHACELADQLSAAGLNLSLND